LANKREDVDEREREREKGREATHLLRERERERERRREGGNAPSWVGLGSGLVEKTALL